MKQKITLAILVTLNLMFIVAIVMVTILGFGLLVLPVGYERAVEMVSLVSAGLYAKLFSGCVIMGILNYLILKKALLIKGATRVCLVLTLLNVIVFMSFHISSKNTYLSYQEGATQLRHFLKGDSIDEISIVSGIDTVSVIQLDEFIFDIGKARFRRGLLKYSKSIHLVIARSNGDIERIYTDGNLIGPYKGMCFSSEDNFIGKYMK